MKKLLLTLACFAGMYGVNAQTFTVPRDTVKAIYTGGTLSMHDNITNITNDPDLKITWKVTACTFPASWIADTVLSICDNSTCQQNTNGQLTSGASFTSADHYPGVPNDFHLELVLHWPHIANANGIYYLVAELKNGNYSRPVVFQVAKWATNVAAKETAAGITLYPNPAKNNLYVNYTGSGALKTLSIHNLIGKMVRPYNAASNDVQLDISDLPAGVYYLRLTDAQGQVLGTRRFTHQ